MSAVWRSSRESLHTAVIAGATCFGEMRPPGKIVVDEFYFHVSAIDEVQNSDAVAAVRRVLAELPATDGFRPNVAKVNLRSGRVSLLAYPGFDSDPFPELVASWIYPPGASIPTLRRYDESLNPPILHRKERMVSWSHPARARWESLTNAAESLGLFDDTSTIGFKVNWQRLIKSKGFQLVGNQFVPLANEEIGNDLGDSSPCAQAVKRHLTALSRTNLSAPVQLLLRHNLLAPGRSFFDYGCGRGGDLEGLKEQGYEGAGWDPHYAPECPRIAADVVNLGFVINVIEDPAERLEALARAFDLTRVVLSVGVMLAGGDTPGKRFRDGYLTSRNTFQKYFSQAEFKDLIEQCLHRQAFMVAPGVAFVFADLEAEQAFAVGRFRTASLATRLMATRSRHERAPLRRPPRQAKEPRPAPPPRLTATQKLVEGARPQLERLWHQSLNLGRLPAKEEASNLGELVQAVGSLGKAGRLLPQLFDMDLLAQSARTRRADLQVFMASQHFAKRATYRQLAPALQRDIKAFFDDYKTAQDAGLRLLSEAADPAKILDACKTASAMGIGHLEAEHSLQLHVSLVERLPPVLRAYVNCGLHIWDSLSDVQLVKIHIGSGKLTLMEFDDFDESPLPLLRRRIKIHVRRLSYDLFEYGSAEFPQTVLYRKSYFLSEEYPGYAEQLAFDEEIERLQLVNDGGFGPRPAALAKELSARRLAISGMRIVPSETLPELDARCGANFTYRHFIECGNTQRRLGLSNVPMSPQTYNALYGLCVNLLDPVIDYFGAIQLTYGFASPALTKHIAGTISPKLDQHACCEINSRGAPVCQRGGAACDFIVEDEDMRAVADWITANLPFDRLYFYGSDRPLHLSFSTNPAAEAFEMVRGPSGRLLPRPLRAVLKATSPLGH